MSKYSAFVLIKNLLDKGFIKEADAVKNFVFSQQQEKELPLYIRALIGVGAIIASLFFIGFLFAAHVIEYNQESAFIMWGVIFIMGAIGLQILSDHDHPIMHSFLMQSSFAFMAVGKTLFVWGMADVLNSRWGAAIAICMVSAATYHVYRMSIDRFLSSFAALFSVLINILWGPDIAGTREILLNSFFLFQLLGAAVLITNAKIKRDYIPLTYSFAFSLCVSTLFLASHAKFGYWKHEEFIHTWFINILLTASLIAVMSWIAGGMERSKYEPLIIASFGALVLGIISVPGIMLSIILMMLGYAKHEKIMIIMGGLLIPVFLFLYYYNLDISLMQKSGALVGSGIVLLAGNFYLKYKGWDNGGSP